MILMIKKMCQIFIVLFHLLLLVSMVIVHGQLIPEPRFGTTANLIGNKIYYVGGYNFAKSTLTSDVFYFDEEKNVWVYSSKGVLPTKVSHASGVGGVNQDLIFI